MEAKEEMMNFQAEREQRIDMKNWIESVKNAEERSNRRSTTSTTQSSWPRIPKVPHQMLRGTTSMDFTKFYEPKEISIGPYHHGKPHLHSVEEIKPLCAKEFLDASGQSVEDVYELIRSKVEEVKKCYGSSPTNEYGDEKLAQMMLLDGCFILQFIVSQGKRPVLREHQLYDVRHDLILLENQIPWGVLELIFERAGNKISIKNMINEFVMRIARQAEGTASEMELEKPAHLLHLLRSALLRGCGLVRDNKNIMSEKPKPQANNINTHGCWSMMMIKDETQSSSSQGGKKNKWQSFRNIRELKAAGIHFKPSGTCFLTDISFESHFFRGYLKLPVLFIDDSTKPMFLNLVAYEMCPDAPDDYGIASFLCFLDTLIDHADDVKELRSDKIIYNLLGSDEDVARIFNEISDGLMNSVDAYEDVKNRIQARYDKKVHTWIAQFLHNHFSSPWTIIGFIAAVLIIVLTMVQTYFTIPW